MMLAHTRRTLMRLVVVFYTQLVTEFLATNLGHWSLIVFVILSAVALKR